MMIQIWNLMIIIQKREQKRSLCKEEMNRDQFIHELEVQKDRILYQSGINSK
ncbi:hypothetical protein [Tepidibacillus marianensis]|uniref:hypothetical protein n=1 Tax=Tepidibacillus marianensis TaxID=3131995 RepID=UPI0030CD2204